MIFSTVDLCDGNEGKVQVLLPGFRDYGARKRFCGPIATVKVYEDNSLVRAALEEPGEGRVLVVDGGASMRCALVGDKLAELGRTRGWAGMVISGCIRDSLALAALDFGIKALGSTPRRSVKKGAGERNIAVTFSGATFNPGDWLYADEDGVLLSSVNLF
ncbi:MAG: ribonuclease E activity regulator RraA [Gammaproteobacteria bacterium]